MHIHVSAYLTILFNNREECKKKAEVEPDRDGGGKSNTQSMTGIELIVPKKLRLRTPRLYECKWVHKCMFYDKITAQFKL